MDSKKFILVQDKNAAMALTKMGFKSIPSGDNTFVFINDGEIKVNFDLIDKSKIYYSNKINI